MTTEAITSLEARKALSYFDQHRGSLRSNANRYKAAVNAIKAAENPLNTAKKLLKDIQAHRLRSTSWELSALYGDPEGKPSTVTLDLLIDFLKAGYRCGHLEPAHHELIEKYEREVLFPGKATRENFVALASKCIALAVFDPRRGVWCEFGKR